MDCFDAIWIPHEDIPEYEADGWEQVDVMDDCLHDHYSALMVRDA